MKLQKRNIITGGRNNVVEPGRNDVFLDSKV
jgi:hypothetical protein